MKSLVFFAILIACANAVKLNQLKGGVCPGSAINQTIFDHLTFVKNITNAVLYQQQDIQPPLNVIHLYGTPYEMGFAHGAIMKDVVTDLYPQVFDWIDQQVKQAMKGYPEWLQKIIEEYGVTGALEATFLMTRAYTPDHFLEELQGFADGSGIDYNTVIQLHMLPELTQAACSMSGAWGPASSTNTLYQLRALDWSIDGPFQQFPSVIVYHPNSDNGHSFAILAWAGFIAALTGMSSEPVGVCEKVWDGYTGELSRSGYPWHYLLRDILQYDQDIDDALSRIATATRTCAIFVGLGDPVNGFRAVEYAHTNVTVYDDRNFPNWPNHFRKTGLVYVDKHVQPSADQCIGTVLQQFYGQIDATTYINYVTPMHQTGDMHIGVYDYQNLLMYVSNASPWINGTCTPAYQRPFIRLDLNQLFALTQN